MSDNLRKLIEMSTPPHTDPERWLEFVEDDYAKRRIRILNEFLQKYFKHSACRPTLVKPTEDDNNE